MMRLNLIVIVLSMICTGSAFAQPAGDSSGLKIVGNVYAWSVNEVKGGVLPERQEAESYSARIEFIVSNEGSETVICPRPFDMWSEIRFVDGSASASVAIVKSRDPWTIDRRLSRSWDEPRPDRFRILEPGDSFRFETFFRIVIRAEGSRPGRSEYWGIFVEERESVRSLLARSHLKFVFRMVPDNGDSDILRTFARRWKKFGVLPLNDAGEIYIETPAFESNSYWIKPEDLP